MALLSMTSLSCGQNLENHPLIGKWIEADNTDWLIDFKPDGTLVPLRGQAGKWKPVSEGKIEIDGLYGSKKYISQYKISGDRMTMTEPKKGARSSYIRKGANYEFHPFIDESQRREFERAIIGQWQVVTTANVDVIFTYRPDRTVESYFSVKQSVQVAENVKIPEARKHGTWRILRNGILETKISDGPELDAVIIEISDYKMMLQDAHDLFDSQKSEYRRVGYQEGERNAGTPSNEYPSDLTPVEEPHHPLSNFPDDYEGYTILAAVIPVNQGYEAARSVADKVYAISNAQIDVKKADSFMGFRGEQYLILSGDFPSPDEAGSRLEALQANGYPNAMIIFISKNGSIRQMILSRDQPSNSAGRTSMNTPEPTPTPSPNHKPTPDEVFKAFGKMVNEIEKNR